MTSDVGGDDVLRLASADNFRDVAGPGHRTTSGVLLRPGVLFRSNELQLIDQDASALAALGIVAVYDLREAHEVAAHPDVEIPGSRWTHVPVGGIPAGIAADLRDPDTTRAEMCGVYRRFVDDEAARASFGAMLRGLATGTGAALFHCTAGKDRTGWAAALVLHIAGVDWADIETDYLLTNERSAATRAKYLGLVAEHLGADRVPTFEPTMIADVEFLQAALEACDASYGGLDAYLREGLEVDDDVLAALRSRLVTS